MPLISQHKKKVPWCHRYHQVTRCWVALLELGLSLTVRAIQTLNGLVTLRKSQPETMVLTTKVVGGS